MDDSFGTQVSSRLIREGMHWIVYVFIFVSIFNVVVLSDGGLTAEILNVTRLKDQGDLFTLRLRSSASCALACAQYGAVLRNNISSVNAARTTCFCQCSYSTFFVTKLGSNSCVSDVDSPTSSSASSVKTTLFPVDVLTTSLSKKWTVGLPTSSAGSSTSSSSKAKSRIIWIYVTLALSAVLLIAAFSIAGLLVIRFKRRRQFCRAGPHLQCRPRLPQAPSDGSTVSPMHDYEYIHYPCLSEGPSSPPFSPVDKCMYERGPDNKLIIWSNGHNTTNGQSSVEAATPRLPYQRLLTRMSSSSVDCGGQVIRPVSQACGDVFPYQMLVRAEVQPTTAERETGVVDPTPGHSVQSTNMEPSGNGYQSLTAMKNRQYAREACDDYTNMQWNSPPGSVEYDYARVPVALESAQLNRSMGNLSENVDTALRASVENSVGGKDIIDGGKQTVLFMEVAENAFTSSNSDVVHEEHPVMNEDEDIEYSTGTSQSAQLGGGGGEESGDDKDSTEYVKTPMRRESVSSIKNKSSSLCLVESDDNSHEYMVLEALETAAAAEETAAQVP